HRLPVTGGLGVAVGLQPPLHHRFQFFPGVGGHVSPPRSTGHGSGSTSRRLPARRAEPRAATRAAPSAHPSLTRRTARATRPRTPRPPGTAPARPRSPPRPPKLFAVPATGGPQVRHVRGGPADRIELVAVAAAGGRQLRQVRGGGDRHAGRTSAV